MKGLIGGLVVYLVLVSLIIFVVSTKFDNIKERVGKEVLFRDDTLMIINYSIWKETYVLEDGREVAFELVKGLGVLEHNK